MNISLKSILCAFFIALFCSVSLASKVPEKAETKGGQGMTILYSMEAHDATLRHVKGNLYELVTSITPGDQVLAFSDRPHRIAFLMSRDKWAEAVHKMKNSFTNNPPNIVLSWHSDRCPQPPMLSGVSSKWAKRLFISCGT